MREERRRKVEKGECWRREKEVEEGKNGEDSKERKGRKRGNRKDG